MKYIVSLLFLCNFLTFATISSQFLRRSHLVSTLSFVKWTITAAQAKFLARHAHMAPSMTPSAALVAPARLDTLDRTASLHAWNVHLTRSQSLATSTASIASATTALLISISPISVGGIRCRVSAPAGLLLLLRIFPQSHRATYPLNFHPSCHLKVLPKYHPTNLLMCLH